MKPLGREPAPAIVFYTDLFSLDTVKFRIYNFFNPEFKKKNTNNFYVVDASLFEDAPMLTVRAGTPFKLHLGIESFGRIWDNFCGYHRLKDRIANLDNKNKYVVDIELFRSKRNVKIKAFRVLQVNGKDDYEEIMDVHD